MNRNALLALAIAGAGMLALGNWLDRPAEVAETGGPLLPGLAEQLNELQSITVTAGGDRRVVTLNREDDSWLVAERNGYPAAMPPIRELTIALADARLEEQKTARPENHGRLGLSDVSDPDARGVAIELRSATDSWLVLIGETFVGGGDYAYARLAGEPQTWLVSGRMDPSAVTDQWLERAVIDIPDTDIRTVVIRQGGAELVIERVEAEGPLEVLPGDAELRDNFTAEDAGSVLSKLELEDVRSAADIPAEALAAEFTTTNDAIYRLSLWQEDGRDWMAVEEAGNPEAAVNRWHYRVPPWKAAALRFLPDEAG